MDRISQTLTDSHPWTAFLVNVPGRVNLIGEHTDYNQGWVLPIAIERGIQMEVRRRDDHLAVLRSGRETQSVQVDLSTPIRPGDVFWGRYVEGVLAGYQKLGWIVPGFDAHITATLPAGGGLSSSAALELATANAIETLCNRSLPPIERALLCQHAEHAFANVQCGIMDQFAITFGQTDQALLLDCRSQEMTPVPLKSDTVAILVIDSGVKHALADGEYAKRRAECEAAAEMLKTVSLRDVSRKLWQSKGSSLPEPLGRRVKHLISENERTLLFVEALKDSDWKTAGHLMYASHESLASDYQVSCPELDKIVQLAQKIPGVFGCRMTGGGFGGCAIALIDKTLAQPIMETFERQYKNATGITPTLFLTHAANGPTVKPQT
jgi:galactokinase